ncbi:MAG: M4 family metallopeptidase, partial [Actinomycetota bacterium]
MRRNRDRVVGRLVAAAVVCLLAMLPAGPATTVPAPADPVRSLERLADLAGGKLEAHFGIANGAFDFIRATGSGPIVRDDASVPAGTRALNFLAEHGSVVGLSNADRRRVPNVLTLEKIDRDAIGMSHVWFRQHYRGVPVFGGQLVVHMDAQGITGVNGFYVPGLNIPTKPSLSAASATRIARSVVARENPDLELASKAPVLEVYRLGLVEGQPGSNGLSYSVEISGLGLREKVVVDALSGAVVQRIPLIHTAKDRIVYTPQYDRENPDRFAFKREGGLPSLPMIENLYRFAGQVHDFFSLTFGRDSYDGNGTTMRSVYLVNEICPNAYWNGETTNYCPLFDLDDVVAHEWGHAYTEFTHNLVYLCQSGALNESYSDVWGETIDLLNGEDGVGGSNNDQPFPAGQRWIVGEDFGRPVQEAILRDMWDPERLGSPAKVSSDNYVCGSGDGGGVHTNSGVPNHHYAMLVDGKTYNGVTVKGIGLTKAAHIYYRAMTNYNMTLTQFPDHGQALSASCHDLIGQPINELNSDQVSAQRISVDDCKQVDSANRAVQFSTPASQCGFQPLLKQGAPPVCPGGKVFYSEDFEEGLGAWNLGGQGVGPMWPELEWTRASPPGREGSAAFAPNPNKGICPGDGDAGQFWIEGPDFVVPSDAAGLRLRFDHWVATDPVDGGNVLAKINDGEFAVIPGNAYLFNPPNGTGGGNNPKAGEDQWSGADGGSVYGSWGTSVADLSEIAKPGDHVQLRFDFGIDCSGGARGWYVDNINLYDCPLLPPPIELRLGSDYADQDPDGRITLVWKRPDRAVGPDLVQDCIGCLPFFTDDAEAGLTNWDTAASGGAVGWMVTNKPAHDSSVFRAIVPDVVGLVGAVGVGDPATATMTLKEPLTIPSTGTTLLTFKDHYGGQYDDLAVVEVLDGASWTPVYTAAGPTIFLDDVLGYASAPLEDRSVDLTKYAGRKIGLRLRHTSGTVELIGAVPVGWYVDDLALKNENWTTLASVEGTSYTARLGGGLHSLRVRTAYSIRGAKVTGDASEPV